MGPGSRPDCRSAGRIDIVRPTGGNTAMTDASGASPGSRPDRCPVCRAARPEPFQRIGDVVYWRCDTCEARFLDPTQRLSRAEEHAVYRLHENAAEDEGYRRFLSKLVLPLLDRLPAGASGLDYGCGPGAALAAMLEEAGHAVALYDPLFRPDRSVLGRRYDFVACTETAEHFHDPVAEFDRLGGLVRPGGLLAVMTCFQTDDARFADWHYRRDPTHVVFYREATLRHVAALRGWTCEIPRKDVAIMRIP